MENQTASEMIKELQGMGVTKWEIKKRLFVHWLSVHRWASGVFPPNTKHLEGLRAILSEKRESNSTSK